MSLLPHTASEMIVADLNEIAGTHLPSPSPHAELGGGRVTDSGHPIFDGVRPRSNLMAGKCRGTNKSRKKSTSSCPVRGEMCLGEERRILTTGQAAYIPTSVFHQLTNMGEEPLIMIYVYGPAGDVAHWKQELEGTLPRAGVEAPPLPDGAQAQTTHTAAD